MTLTREIARKLWGLPNLDLRVKEVSGHVAGAAVGGEGSFHDLHVLLRHRLLRKPDGFEGVWSLADAFDADHRCSSKGPDLEVPQAAGAPLCRPVPRWSTRTTTLS